MSLSMQEKLRVEEIIEAAKDQPSLLNDWEQNFMQSQIENMEKYGENYRLTPKQWDTINKIAVKLAL